VFLFSISAGFAFFLNLGLTIWAASASRPKGGVGILYEGNCLRIRNLNIAIHVGINILSTIILSGSNYCMQCLSAPTRKEIDTAHTSGVWMDVGIPSFRNIWRVNWKRSVLWWIFMFVFFAFALL